MRVRSPGSPIDWKKNLGKMYEFILSQDEKRFEIDEVELIWSKDLFICSKKDVGVPTIQLVQVEA